jgi:hypothetical protein
MGSVTVGVHGSLTYLALPPHLSVVDERDCPALRLKTHHFIRDARQPEPEAEPELEPRKREPGPGPEPQPEPQPKPQLQSECDLLLLRTSGFQLFREVPPPPDTEGSAAMAAHKHSIEEFVRVKLQAPGNFKLSCNERVSHVIAYNHAVRCSDNRQCRGAKPIISDVHTDFTRASGPIVLAHVLGGCHLRPSQRKARKFLLEETLRGRYRYCFLNVWRSLDTERPVSEWPLALLHPRSCNPLAQHLQHHIASPLGHAIKTKKHAIFPENCPPGLSAYPRPAHHFHYL